ncbi:MAG: tetratricopeptide repeat protein [Alphaproteobacteria bacterium]|nr:tetratricopeptide repeat protein [Alphaproteobacteria bacterium]
MRFASVLTVVRLGVYAAIAVAIGAGTPHAATPMAVETSSADGGARLRFLWPERVTAKSDRDGDAVVVTVDKAVDPKAVRDVASMLPGWIASAEAEDGRLRLRPQPGRSLSVAALPRGVEIRLSRSAVEPPAPSVAAVPPVTAAPSDAVSDADEEDADDPPRPPAARPVPPPPGMIGAVTVVPGAGLVAQAPPPADPEAAAAARRLRLTRARLMMETGDAAGAKAELEALLREVPNSVEVMSALASVESQLGGWRRAVGLYDRALGLNPDDPGLIRAKAELLREHGPRVRFDLDHRKVKKADRQIVARLSGEALAGPSIVGFALEGNDLDTPAVRRLNGSIETFDGKRYRGEGYVSMDHETGGLTRLSLIGGNGIVGAAVRHTRQFAEGTLRLAAIAQDPYWDVVDGLVNEARTDRVQAAYERILGTSWRVAGRLAAGRYGVEGRSDVAHFIGPAFEAAYTIVHGPPSLTLAYGFDAEYLGSRKVAVDSFGAEYPLLSVVSREVHSIIGGLSGTFSPDLRYNAFGGFAYDRLNANGPFLGVDIAYEPYTSFEVGLAASYSLTASRGTDATVTRIGGYFLWRF